MKQTQTIQHILATSYIVYFLASLAGLLADTFLAVPFRVPFATPIAIVLFGLGPLLIFWAQRTSAIHQNNTYFHYGPYRLMRNPTHVGLLLLVTGYTLISGSLIFFGTTLLGFLVSNIFFTKYERLNESTYGEKYKAYRSTIPKL